MRKKKDYANDDTCESLSVFGFEFVLREGQSIEEFAGTDWTSLDDVQFRVLHTILNTVDPDQGKRMS